MDLTLNPGRAAAPITQKDRPAKTSWPLMGDIVSHRADIPEHLIQWRRAMGDTDPILRDSGPEEPR